MIVGLIMEDRFSGCYKYLNTELIKIFATVGTTFHPPPADMRINMMAG